MLDEQLQNELDQEAKAQAKKLTGRVQIFRMGYEAGHYDGAEKYASKWQEEKELRERYEKALKGFASRMKEYCEKMGITSLELQRITIDMEEFNLTHKMSSDE